MQSTRLLGLEFANLSLDEATGWVLARSPQAPFDYVVTPNADHLVRIAGDPVLTAVYRNASLRLLDSRVVAGAARAFGLAAPGVVTGSDLTERVLRDTTTRERVTIIGLGDAWLPRLIQRTGLATPAHYDPPIGFDRDPAGIAAAVRFVIEHPARLVFLAVGSPRQEILAAAIKATGKATGLGLCIGASLDFLAGVTPRAPYWMQSAGLEWLHRLGRDPYRLARRYLLQDPAVFSLLLRERVAHKLVGAQGLEPWTR